MWLASVELSAFGRSLTVRDAFSIWKKEKRTNTVASFSDETAAGFHDGRFGVWQAHLPGGSLSSDVIKEKFLNHLVREFSI